MPSEPQDARASDYTLDQGIVQAQIHDPWFRISRVVVSAGMLLGLMARLIYGREFDAADPVIGPLLGPLSFVWLMAFLHMFYVMVKIRLSKFTRIASRLFFAGIGLVLGKLLIVDWLLNLRN